MLAALLRCLPPESGHRLALKGLRLLPAAGAPADDPILGQTLWGRPLANPIGLAAGFDKDGEAIRGLFALGFGAVEVGTVTPRPQPGNPRPRLFRLTEDRAVINRMGFNNQGHAALALGLDRIGAAPWRRDRLLGVNLGKNKESTDALDDYVRGVAAFSGLADYLAINVSSPNTPGLRALQGRAELDRLLEGVMGARPSGGPPVLLKVAPDLTAAERADIAEIALARGIDGLIVSNTTLARPLSLRSRFAGESGGLSGRPLFAPSTEALREFRRLTGGRLPLIGVGGVASAADAYAKIRAGASLVQVYSALVFEGTGLIRRIKRDLAALLRADGFSSLAAAVGVS